MILRYIKITWVSLTLWIDLLLISDFVTLCIHYHYQLIIHQWMYAFSVWRLLYPIASDQSLNVIYLVWGHPSLILLLHSLHSITLHIQWLSFISTTWPAQIHRKLQIFSATCVTSNLFVTSLFVLVCVAPCAICNLLMLSVNCTRSVPRV